MKTLQLRKTLLSLSKKDQTLLVKDLSDSLEDNSLSDQTSRRYILDNKMGEGPLFTR